MIWVGKSEIDVNVYPSINPVSRSSPEKVTIALLCCGSNAFFIHHTQFVSCLAIFLAIQSTVAKEARAKLLRYINLTIAMTFAMVSPVVERKLGTLEDLLREGGYVTFLLLALYFITTQYL